MPFVTTGHVDRHRYAADRGEARDRAAAHRLSAGFPNASLAIKEGLSAYIVEWVTTGRADIGVVFNPPASPEIERVPLLEDTMHLIGAKQERRGARTVLLRELAGYPLMLPSRPNANRMRVETELAYLGLKPSIVLELDGILSLLDAVRAGFGYAVLPLTMLRPYKVDKAFSIRTTVKPKLLIQLSLITSARRPTTPLTRQMLQVLPQIALPILKGQENRRQSWVRAGVRARFQKQGQTTSNRPGFLGHIR